MNERIKTKSGSLFEALIACIQQSVHNRANIETNKKLKDVDTGKLRQIDISLRLSDGPTEFFAMIEVRDHSRPVGAPYIGEISDKRRSVRADAAFIVSRSGFTKSALTKAEKLGIRALTYDEATNADWSNWLQCKTMSVYARKYDSVKLVFAEFGSNHILNLSSENKQIFKNNKNAKILKTIDGAPFISFPELINRIINSIVEQIFKEVPLDGTHQQRSVVISEGQLAPPLYIEGADGQLRRIGKMRLDISCYLEESQYPFKLMKYHQADVKNSIAEIATTEISVGENKYRIALIVPGAGEHIPAGTQVTLRTTKLNK
jgi:hypothetical protein